MAPVPRRSSRNLVFAPRAWAVLYTMHDLVSVTPTLSWLCEQSPTLQDTATVVWPGTGQSSGLSSYKHTIGLGMLSGYTWLYQGLDCYCIMTRGGKYSLSPRKIPRAKPKGFSKGSGYISPFILTQVIIQTLSISKNDTLSIVLPGWAMLVELIFVFALAFIYQYSPSSAGWIMTNSVFPQLNKVNIGKYCPVSKQYWRVPIQYYQL